MPTLLTPGVYIQEVALGPSPIQGVATSVAGFVGEAERGPVNGAPTLVTSYNEFNATFGSFVAGKYLAYAVQGFFNNGGQQAYIARVLPPATASANFPASLTVEGNGYYVDVKAPSPAAAPGASQNVILSSVVGLQIGAGNLTFYDFATQTPIEAIVNAVNPLTGVVNVTLIGTSASLAPSTYYALASSAAALPTPPPTPVMVVNALYPGFYGNDIAVYVDAYYANSALVTAVLPASGLIAAGQRLALSSVSFLSIGDQVQLDTAAASSATATSGEVLTIAPAGGTVAALESTTLILTINPETTTVTFPGTALASASAVAAYINAYPGLAGVASINGGGDLVLNASSYGSGATVSVSGSAATTLGFPTPAAAILTGTMLVAPATLTGESLVITMNQVGPVSINFPPAGPSAVTTVAGVASFINNYGPGLANVASINSAGKLVLTAPAIGGVASITISGSAAGPTLLNLPATTTGAPAGRETRIVTAIDVAGGNVTFDQATAPPAGGSYAKLSLINWRVATYYKGALVETLTGLSAALSGVTSGYAGQMETTVNGQSGWIQLAVGQTFITAAENGASTASPSTFPTFAMAATTRLSGPGSDTAAGPNDIIGSDVLPYSGLKAIENQDGVDIIAAPGWASGTGPGSVNDAVVVELIGQAERRLDRFAVFETLDPADVTQLLAERGKYNSQYAAMYAPWVTILDPLSGNEINVPPSGHIIGQYANTDNLRGVFKSPANVVLQGILGFSRSIPTGEQDLLNPADVNVLRNFPGLGNVIWGARTLAADPLWKYICVRRLFIFLEQSIVQGTRYAVFEPNDPNLWNRLSASVTNFLTTQWRAGALFGNTAAQAFFVRADATTTTQDDRDNGIVNILVGVAPVKPAEFIVFQIGQASSAFILAESGSS